MHVYQCPSCHRCLTSSTVIVRFLIEIITEIIKMVEEIGVVVDPEIGITDGIDMAIVAKDFVEEGLDPVRVQSIITKARVRVRVGRESFEMINRHKAHISMRHRFSRLMGNEFLEYQ